jgi:hypothetical protein
MSSGRRAGTTAIEGCRANQKKYLVSGIPTVSLNCRSVGRRTMTRPRPSFLSHTHFPAKPRPNSIKVQVNIMNSFLGVGEPCHRWFSAFALLTQRHHTPETLQQLRIPFGIETPAIVIRGNERLEE